jgi:asparagine synthase (glutamine-hydrolysing)
MCGITGFKSTIHQQGDLEQMTEVLAHRGPDAFGYYSDVDTGVFLGHRRLSIIDLTEAANQPMESNCGRYVMVYNGEVYNYQEIAKELDVPLKTKSDTEVILEAFVKWGVEFVHRLNGMFVLAIYDKQEDKLFLFRDRLGIKPLFYACSEGNFLFASELKSLKNLSGIDYQVSKQAVYNFLHLGYIPEPLTIYKGVHKFPIGAWAVFEKGELHIQSYWKAQDKIMEDTIKDFSQAKSTFKGLIESSVAYRMISDVPFGTFLSGGIDSSLVTAVAQQHSSGKLNTFSIGFKDKKHDESAYAKSVASYLNTDHHELFVTEKDALEKVDMLTGIYDEPYADSSAIPTMLVSELARKQVTMTLSGDGGDELFMGYGAYRWAKRLNNPLVKGFGKTASSVLKTGLAGQRYQRAAGLFEKSDFVHSHIFSQEQYFFSERELGELLSYDTMPENATKIDFSCIPRNLSQPEKQALFDLNFYLKDDLLVKVDRASMKYSLETRVPLLDYRIVEFALNLDSSFKFRKGELKYFLKQVLYDYVPASFFERPKQGFSVPLASWLKSDLKYLISDYLSNEVIQRYGIVKPEAVKQLLQCFSSGKHDYLYNRIWLLIVLHRWMGENF